MSLPRYEQYKDSGVEWLGEVPAHWFFKPLWAMFHRTKRTGFESEELLSIYRDHGVVLKASRDDNNNKPSDDLSPYQLVTPGDLAINKMKAWQGSVAISEYRGIVSPAYFVYQAIHAEDPRFLHYLMRSPRYTAAYLSMSKGIRVNQWDLDPACHSKMPVLLPLLFEQTAIATFLDRETAKIDDLVAEQRNLIGLLKEKRQALISHAVTKGLDPAAPMKDSGVEWLGKVPKHWTVRPLRSLSSVVRGASPRPAGDPRYFDGEFVPWVTVAEITKDNSIYLTDVDSYLTEDGYHNSRLFSKGMLIYSNSGATLGVAKILTINACANDGVVGFDRLNEEALQSVFLYYFLGSMTQTMRDMIKQGSGQPNLNTDIVKAIRIALPPREEQRSVVIFLDQETAKIDDLIAEAETASTLLQERRTALISAAVTGKIDVRNRVAVQPAPELEVA
jgi:type I restriction enzyme S subunit